MNTNVETFKYDNRIVRAFAIATVVWGIVGMLGRACWRPCNCFSRTRT